MRYLAIASDYDGTLAHHGCVDEVTINAVKRLRDAERRFILATGRELRDLLRAFPDVGLCDLVVAENGAVVYEPSTRRTRLLADPAPARLVELLRGRGVEPLSVGEVIIATWHPNESVVLESIRDLGLEHHVIFNKGAVMVLPPGINKATGLTAALEELKLSAHNVIGVGDAENDHAFLRACGCSVAVSNALDSVKDEADYVTVAARGAGVTELIDAVLDNDLAELDVTRRRAPLVLGRNLAREELSLAPLSKRIVVAGSSGGGKSSLVGGLLEQMTARGYQFLLIDPEGDYVGLPSAVSFGAVERAPAIEEVCHALLAPDENVIVNLLDVPLADRPKFVEALLLRVQTLRSRFGRPHLVVVDEAHHCLPSGGGKEANPIRELTGMVLVTVDPATLGSALEGVSVVVTVGEGPLETLNRFGRATRIGVPPRAAPPDAEGSDLALLWLANEPEPVWFQPARHELARRRHRRKYAEGELGPDKSFYFRGPEGRLNLRAHNLITFVNLLHGVDDETWAYHLSRGDYSRWVLESIKDEVLAAELRAVEARPDLGPAEARELADAAIRHHYTAPA